MTKKLSTINDYYRKLQTSVLLLFLSCFSFVFIPYIVADANAITEASASVTWNPLSLTLSDGGDVSFSNLTPSSDGTMEVVKKSITVETTGKAYAVYLSMDADSNRLHYNGDATSTLGIPATTGTFATPTTFSGRGWGYAVPGVNNFSASSIYNSISLNENIFSNEAGYNIGTWAAVPVSNAAQKIYNQTLSSTATSDSFDVYYAVMVDNDLIAGTYSNHLVYTALAASTSLDAVSNNLSVRNASTETSQRIVTHGDTLTLNFDLSQSTAGLVTKDKTKVYLVPHSTVTAADYALTDTIKNNKASYPVCEINNNSTDFVISNDATAGAIINCTIGESTNGTIAGVEGNNNGAGSYDVWVNIEDYGINYFSKYLTSDKTATLPSIIFAGLQSRDSSGYIVSKMQEMTPSVCKNTNEWGTGYGADARVYNYTSSGSALADSASASATIGTGTFLLADSRDDKTYLVRRLADGNCWMVQNLDYDLALQKNRTLSPATSDVSEEKTLSNHTQAELGTTLGYACEEQYQGMNHFGSNCIWGVNVNGTLTDNATSGFARSYNNDLGYIEGTSNTSNPTNCAAITGDSAIWSTDCAMSGRRTEVSSTVSISGYAVNNTKQDSAWQPSLVTNSDGDTFTMRGSMYYGNYYNWYAATAESGKFDMGSNADATDSICPRGWQLPINGDSTVNKSWQHLISGTYSYNVVNGTVKNGLFASNRAALNKIMQLPLSVPFAGQYEWSNGVLGDRGDFGSYWSSTATTTGEGMDAFYMGVNYAGVVTTQGLYRKARGLTIRCVAK